MRFLVLMSLLHTAVATITMADTGERFATKPDPILGERLADGYEYMARLQHLDDNLDLCPTGNGRNQYNVTVPPDGLPVVLLAKGAHCSDLSKARTASLNIYPPHIVKYLIIFDVPDDMLLRLKDMETIHVAGSHTVIEETTVGGRGRVTPHRYDKDISVYILHTSLLIGTELLQYIDNHDAADHPMGGPRVLLDGRTSADTLMKNVLFGCAMAVMISGCFCSFMLSLRLNDLLGQEVVQTTTRDPRMQLTLDQVEEWLPPMEYQPDEEFGDDHACSICLDEFISRDSVRQLPCKHIFHEDCVGKWLVERSSTCPLCKLDLLHLPEEDEESEDEAIELTPMPRPFWRRLWPAFLLERVYGLSDSSSISMQGGAAQPLLQDYQIVEDELSRDQESRSADETAASEVEAVAYDVLEDSEEEREHHSQLLEC